MHTPGGGSRRGVLRALASSVLLLVCGAVLLPPPSASGSDGGYVEDLTERAHRERLAERPEWLALLHYEARKGKSLVTTEGFFLSPVGRVEPRAELDATLAAFFGKGEGDADESAPCRYPARYHWLARMLGFDGRLPPPSCGRFARWFAELNPDRVTLVFPSAYLNNPASMFGHTLLRIDGPGQQEETRLLSYSVNYAADTHRERGVEFAFKGLFGLYPGSFSVAPYYLQVKAYGDTENRDIWEYGLNLTAGETGQLLRHLWELRSARFDYYFLDENCSSQLLSLLETARPGLGFSGRFTFWAFPSETVRAVTEAGLVTSVRFRPSRSTVIAERARLLNGPLRTLAKSAADHGQDGKEMGSLAPVDRARVLELAADYASYRQGAALPGLLEARSHVDAPDQTPAIAAPGVPPGSGHRPARAGIGYGIDDGRQFMEFTVSPGYHELLDPGGGFVRGAQVMVLNAAVRYYPDEARLGLERLDILDIRSLPSWGRFLRPISWNVALGVGRKRRDSSHRPLMGMVDGGAGLSHDISRDTSVYLFAGGTLEVSDRFAYLVAPGVGPGLGVIHDVSKRWRTGLFFRERFFFLHESRNDYEVSTRNRFTLNGASVLGCDLAWKREFKNSFGEGKLTWKFYF